MKKKIILQKIFLRNFFIFYFTYLHIYNNQEFFLLAFKTVVQHKRILIIE